MMRHWLTLLENFNPITDDDIELFMFGACHALALAIHKQAGLPIVVIWAEGVDQLIPAHVCNRLGDMFIDVRGSQTWESFSDGYSWSWGDPEDAAPDVIYQLMKRKGETGLPLISSSIAIRAEELAPLVLRSIDL